MTPRRPPPRASNVLRPAVVRRPGAAPPSAAPGSVAILRWGVVLFAAALLGGGVSVPAEAQLVPGSATPRIALEDTLPNGLILTVVTGTPGSDPGAAATGDLWLPGGSALDPEGRAGTASLTAALLGGGTTERGPEAFAEALAALGAGPISIEVGVDRTRIGVSGPAENLPALLGLLAEAVRSPTFTDARVAGLRERTVQALEAEGDHAESIASRRLAALLWGGHPFSRTATAETVARITPAAVRDFHAATWGPSGARLVVAGPVDPEAVARAAAEGFAGWTEPPAPVSGAGLAGANLEARTGLPDRSSPRFTIVHLPGTRRAELRVGTVLPTDADSLSTALSIGTGLLSVRLAESVRELAGMNSAATARVIRTAGPDAAVIAASVPAAVVAEALEAIFDAVAWASGGVDEAALTAMKAAVLEARTSSVVSATDWARELADVRLLGLPDARLTSYEARVSDLEAADVVRAVRAGFDPSRAEVVIVGDAAVLRPALSAYGAVSVVSPEGDRLAPDEFEAAELPSIEAAPPSPSIAIYRVRSGGQVVGEARVVVEAGGTPGTLRARSEVEVGSQRAVQIVEFEAEGFRILGTTLEVVVGGETLTGELRRRGERLAGRITAPTGSRAIDTPGPPGAITGELLELVLRGATLEVGDTLTLGVLDPAAGAVERVPVRVEAAEEVTVEAGTFRALRVRIGGSAPRLLWVREQAPHLLLTRESGGQPVRFELVRFERGGGDG